MQETQHIEIRNAEGGMGNPRTRRESSEFPIPHSPFRIRRAFTLTELLIVIAIIAVLAALITAAARRAFVAGTRAQVVLEIKNMSGSLENFKNDYGSYPPNASNDGTHQTSQEQTRDDLVRMFKKAFPRMNSQEEQVVRVLAGETPSNAGNVVTSNQLVGGITAAEALVFWLGGFSDDAQFPISGEGGPSFVDNNVDGDEILENRKWRYEFTFGQLGPRSEAGAFHATDYTGDPGLGRFVEYTITVNGVDQNRRINLWRYSPKGLERNYMYFDVSRYKPAQYDPPADAQQDPTENIFALKRVREGVTDPSQGNAEQQLRRIAFVNQGKFQILSAGLDDDWGETATNAGTSQWGTSASATSPQATLSSFPLFPDGPFIGPIADTLTNFADGELADEQENE